MVYNLKKSVQLFSSSMVVSCYRYESHLQSFYQSIHKKKSPSANGPLIGGFIESRFSSEMLNVVPTLE